ncbi:MAG TPA: bifunctional phosphopantothenoylcysteine decarboxylase/phosphopantothenate--cysteine ligase CoaBC, partial [Anseongella sp.]|nr:bifunctional phosphopantothenoylcysteine decarboxylase/phosphopantothenate--cysteine ligase CoaBC [Anseongella sp.]
MLRQKNILLGVCGSIAAFKSAALVRHFVKEGANVRVIMTPAATEFITPLTLGTLSREPVLTELSDKSSAEWNNHVALGLWADLFLVAPASAHTIAKFAAGLCDNLLTAVYLSAKCPVYVAPAMDLDMWKHPSTQHNIALLKKYGNGIIPPAYGELASGLSGEGRLAEPQDIIAFIESASAEPDLPGFKGKKVLVTAGPTYEAIDPVRFIGNHSSGKMGFALAEELAGQGAEVELVSGPTPLEAVHASIKRTRVITAAQMHEACMKIFPSCDIAVLSAAVSDYAPARVSHEKIKKNGASFSLELRKNRDILADLGELKKNGQLLIGFALETNRELENAREKLRKKNLDLIVLNSLRDEGAGFGT